MTTITVFNADNFLNDEAHHKLNPLTSSVYLDGDWHVARPFGKYNFKHRVKCAWQVFLGKADVLEFYKQ